VNRRNPKAEIEIRNPKSRKAGRISKSEKCAVLVLFGLRPALRDFGFRISDFGLRPSDFEKIGFSIRFRNFETVALFKFTAGRKSWIIAYALARFGFDFAGR